MQITAINHSSSVGHRTTATVFFDIGIYGSSNVGLPFCDNILKCKLICLDLINLYKYCLEELLCDCAMRNYIIIVISVRTISPRT